MSKFFFLYHVPTTSPFLLFLPLNDTPLIPSTRAILVCYCVISVTSFHVAEITRPQTGVALAAILSHYSALALWCFLLLSFLSDQETPRSPASNLDEPTDKVSEATSIIIFLFIIFKHTFCKKKYK